MNNIASYFLKSLASSSESLKKKGILVEKPWAFIDDDGKIQKLIFKRNNGLILSKNGQVKEGSWEYFPEAKSLLINRGSDKLLLNEQFIDDNVLILKKDGTENDFFTLANENTIPDYNIPKYLNSIKCKELKIEERKLFNGNIIQIHRAKNSRHLSDMHGNKVELIDTNFNPIDISDGEYLSHNREISFRVDNGRINSICLNMIKELSDGKSIEIENGGNDYMFENINKRVTINGSPISDSRLFDDQNLVYEIKESRIAKILVVKEYELKDGTIIKIEQSGFTFIKKGDKIVEATPIFPLPDGKYKIKGQWGKIKVKNCTIV
ncbi:hypothetical protein QA597_02520 [Marinilabiliaceae bacterium ANBcel2]|nr:hypothetical protein [Marinilabiliaceae bacterium ANBcel2]